MVFTKLDSTQSVGGDETCVKVADGSGTCVSLDSADIGDRTCVAGVDKVAGSDEAGGNEDEAGGNEAEAGGDEAGFDESGGNEAEAGGDEASGNEAEAGGEETGGDEVEAGDGEVSVVSATKDTVTLSIYNVVDNVCKVHRK